MGFGEGVANCDRVCVRVGVLLHGIHRFGFLESAKAGSEAFVPCTEVDF